MDEEDINEEIQKVTEIGQENLGILVLAAAWCKHIDVERGPMGVGLVEQMTGLPISGGSLRCPYAEPATSFGMQLKYTAIDFYERNCVGCVHHEPTGTTPNLGTWGDEVIAERKEAERKAAEEKEAERKRRVERRERRRLAMGSRDPAIQAILDLIDRVDSEDGDKEAERLLQKTAELSPQDFPDALLNHLEAEAVATRRGALLEVVFAVFESSGRPAMDKVLELAFSAIRSGLAIGAAGRVIAAHAKEIPAEVAVRRGLVRLASGSFNFNGTSWTGSEPAAFVRFYDIAPSDAVDTIVVLLRDQEHWMRAMAAHAADALVQARPESGAALLNALLDCVLIRDGSRYHGDPFPATAAADVVADILSNDPAIDDAIASRIATADERGAKELWKCYSNATRSRFRESVPDATLGVIERRAKKILEGDFPIGLHADVAETLSYESSDPAGSTGVSLGELIELLRKWNRKAKEAQSRKPTDPSTMQAFLEWQSDKVQVDGVVRRIGEALKRRAGANAVAYIEAVESLWNNTGRNALSEDDRSSLLEAFAAVHTQDALDRAEPLLTRVLTGGTPIELIGALDALERMRLGQLALPESIQRLIVENFLTHDRLIVVRYAIRALRVVDVADDERPKVVERLLAFGDSYKRETLMSDDVESALGRATSLAVGQVYEKAASGIALRVIDGMATSDAADALEHLPRLRSGPEWVASVIRALGPDDRGGEWWGLHERRKQDLLRLLAGSPQAWLESHWDALEAAAQADLDVDGPYTWAIADLFARHGQHARSVRLSQAVVDATPDTHESRYRRRLALLVNLHHRISAAADDPDEAQRLTSEALALDDSADSDDA